MRETRTASSRRITRSSKPSTSSESENPVSTLSDATSPRSYSARRKAGTEGEDSTSTPSESDSKRVVANKSAKLCTQRQQQSSKLLTRNSRSWQRKRKSSSDANSADASEPTPSTVADSSSAS
ncbi:hypothetical protein COOONC_27089, partial [Cooperia oncophora]